MLTVPINAENIRPLPDVNDGLMPPIIDERQLKSIQALVDSYGYSDVPPTFPGRYSDSKVVILLEGA